MASAQPAVARAPEKARSGMRDVLYPTLLVALVLLVSLPSLTSTRIDDIDSAHHIMDGIFFRDFFADLPGSALHPISYALSYYRQYPALGFVLWPPVFPLVEGVMFLATTVDVRVARLCSLAFGVLLALVGYRVLRTSQSRLAAFLGIAVLVSTPSISTHYQQVMREVPAIAMMFAVVWCYYRAVRKPTPTVRDLAIFAAVSTAAVYTKQTTAFVFAAILTDVVVNRRELLRDKRVWATAAVIGVLLAPLLLFTLTIGQANIVQSFGSDKTYVLNTKAPPDRWTLAGWLYYPTRLPYLVHAVVIALGVGGLILGFARSSFFRSHALWFGWMGAWYLLFSYFSNKQDRYALFWLPAWIALSVACLTELNRLFKWKREYAHAALAIPLVTGILAIPHIVIDGFDGVDAAVRSVMQHKTEGNILFVGPQHQIIVPFVRQYDRDRTTTVLRGDEVGRSAADILSACRDFRARIVIVQGDADPANAALDAIAQTGAVSKLQTFRIETRTAPVLLSVYQYSGPIAQVQKDIPLGRGKVGGSAAKTMGL